MANWCLSNDAAEDLVGIYAFSHRRFGIDQADQYLDSLQEAFQRLLQHPGLGRTSADLPADVRGIEHRRHVVFFFDDGGDIVICRVLHDSMDVDRHL